MAPNKKYPNCLKAAGLVYTAAKDDLPSLNKPINTNNTRPVPRPFRNAYATRLLFIYLVLMG